MTELPKSYRLVALEQDTPEWRDWRRGGFGSSDMAALLGMGWGSANDLIDSKRQRRERRPNVKMQRGKQLEPAARYLYRQQTGKDVEPACLEHVFFPWARASLDGFNAKENHAVEIKAGKAAYRKACDRIIPPYYQCQLQHIMFVAGLPQIDYWSCDPDNLDNHCLILVKRDEEFIKSRLIPVGENFSRQLPEAM